MGLGRAMSVTENLLPSLQKGTLLLEIWSLWQRLAEQWVSGAAPSAAVANLLLQSAGNFSRRNSAQGRADHILNNSSGEFIPPLFANCPSSLGCVCGSSIHDVTDCVAFLCGWSFCCGFFARLLRPGQGQHHPLVHLPGLLQRGFLCSKSRALKLVILKNIRGRRLLCQKSPQLWKEGVRALLVSLQFANSRK